MAGLWGFARPGVQCAGPSWRSSGHTLAVAPAAQRPGAYRYVELRLAVARGVIHSKDMPEGIVPWLAGPLQPLVPGHAVAGIAGPGRTEWRMQSRIAFSASLGRNLPYRHT